MATLNAETPRTEIIPVAFFDPEVDVPQERQLFDGLLTSSDLVVWIGREKHRKTNLLLQLSFCAALGRDFMTFRYRGDEPASVVYFDYESKTASLKHRYEAMCRSMSLDAEERKCLARKLKIVEVRKIRITGQPFPRFPKTDGTAKDAQFWRQLINDNPADLYIIDPMRCFHGGKEEDVEIERLLEQVRRYFGWGSVIISHHMRKQTGKPGETRLTLSNPGVMREWSDGARGSVAIKAHADVIVCQERKMEGENEVVYFGAFMKDGPDIEPIPLTQTEEESFLFAPSRQVPPFLRGSYDVLKAAEQSFDRTSAARLLQEHNVKRSTAFKHVQRLCELGLLQRQDAGQLQVAT